MTDTQAEGPSWRCRDCLWFSAHDKDRTWGDCRHQSPRVRMSRSSDNDDTAVWPPVQASDWCGQFARNTQLPLPMKEDQA